MPILIGIIILFFVYGISVTFNLPITQAIFRSFWGFFLVILAIIFQKELRRFFEMLGVLGIKRKISGSLPDQELKILTQTVKNFSEKKIGALIVLPGNENVERHLDGGFLLNGKISEPLLMSIFDTSSPGHDGAVIVEKSQVKKFGVHLPLAENIEAVKRFGTRHRAALGLSEATDSLSIVVSEERGAISLAYNKQLIPIDSFEELEKRLRRFFEEKFPKKDFNIYQAWLKQNLSSLATAFVIAWVVWFLFSAQTSTIQRNFAIPIEFKNTPNNYMAQEYSPEEVVATISGNESDFNLFNPDQLKATVDLSNTKLGWRRILITSNEINIPLNLSIVKLDPDSIELQIIKELPGAKP